MDLGDFINVLRDTMDSDVIQNIEANLNGIVKYNRQMDERLREMHLSFITIRDLMEDIRDKMPGAHERCAIEVMKTIWSNTDPNSPNTDMAAIAQIAAVQGKHMQMALEDFDKRYPERPAAETEYIAKHLESLKEGKNETD